MRTVAGAVRLAHAKMLSDTNSLLRGTAPPLHVMSLGNTRKYQTRTSFCDQMLVQLQLVMRYSKTVYFSEWGIARASRLLGCWCWRGNWLRRWSRNRVGRRNRLRNLRRCGWRSSCDGDGDCRSRLACLPAQVTICWAGDTRIVFGTLLGHLSTVGQAVLEPRNVVLAH